MLLLLALSFFAPLITAYTANDFIVPVQCVNPGFDMTGYLAAQRRMMDQSAQYDVKATIGSTTITRGKHKWVRIGNKANCMHEYADGRTATNADQFDPSGCFPFTVVTKKFKGLLNCILRQPTLRSKDEEIIARIAMIAAKPKNAQNWESADNWDHLFQPTKPLITHIVQCTAEYFYDKQLDLLKCWSVVMGQPGISYARGKASPLQDQYYLAKEYADSQSYACNAPPSCSRLTLQSLYNFQSVGYDFTKFQHAGWWKNRRAKHSNWIKVGSSMKSRCMLQPRHLGDVICWHFPTCYRETMKSTCQKYPQCCPTNEVHRQCQQLGNRGCNVCPKTEHYKSAFQLWRMSTARKIGQK